MRSYKESPARFILPNAMTVARPFITWKALQEIKKGNKKKGYGLLALAGATDADGTVARATNSVTRIGGYLDPIADRIMLAIVIKELEMSGHTKLVTIAAETGIAAGAIALSRVVPDLEPKASLAGKIRFNIHLGAALYLLEHPGDEKASRAMAGASIATFADYARQGYQTIKNK